MFMHPLKIVAINKRADEMLKEIDKRALAELLSAPPQQRLFVYGTLMQAAGSNYGQAARMRLVQEAPQRLVAQTRGQLYELGQYPGLVAGTVDDSAVHGELMLLRDPAVTLPWLDEYEAISPVEGADNEYARQLREIMLPGGPAVSAWTYVYVKPVRGLRRIVSGRWQSLERQRVS
jgi:gamma-glutamylcyclotransferase (GGCT)/AIG2-like uncharacterized protein YtfP